MKKNMVRIVAALLVAMLALTLIPMGAFAIDPDVIFVQKEYYETEEPSYYDYMNNWQIYGSADQYAPGDTIKYSDYNKTLHIGDSLYDFAGFDYIDDIDWDSVDWENYDAWAKDTALPFYNSNISIPKELDDDFKNIWGYDGENKATWIYAAYTPHQHKLSNWYSDGTTHWRECLVCKQFAAQGFWDQFMYQNWCQDGDEDGICNVCGGDVPYHDITVIESEGGKITLNRDNASHRTKITADVEAEEGYKLKKLHFVKVRDDGSKQEITRHKKNGQFWTLMPTYEMEVSAEFVKTGK